MKHQIQNLIGSIVAARKARNISQSEMARKLGMPQSYLSRLESGKLDVRLSSLVDVARFLGLEIVLIPNTMIPTVESLTKAETTADSQRPLYNIEDIESEGP